MARQSLIEPLSETARIATDKPIQELAEASWWSWRSWRSTWRRARGQALQLAGGFAVALILIVTLSRMVNLGSVLARLGHLNFALALACGAAFLSAYVVRALRWRILLAPRQVSIWRAVTIYQVAIFINWLLPVRGGELVKSVLLRRLDDVPISESLPTIAMDKAMDLLPAVTLLALVPFVGLRLSQPLWVLLLFALLVLGVGGAFLGLMAWRRQLAESLLARAVAFLPTRIRERALGFLLHFVDALLAVASRPRVLLVAAGYTAVAVMLDALFCLLAFAAIGANVAFPLVLYGYTFFNLGYILPTPPGQIGSNELIGLLIFSGVFQVNPGDVATMFVFSHPWTALLMVISGLLSLSTMGLSLRTTLALTRSSAAGDTQHA
jgi:uncharacterized protein (TIRG00374 family)